MINLTPLELREITQRQHGKAQSRVLSELGIPHKIRKDNTVIVLRAAYEQVMGLSAKTVSQYEPDFGAFDGT